MIENIFVSTDKENDGFWLFNPTRLVWDQFLEQMDLPKEENNIKVDMDLLNECKVFEVGKSFKRRKKK